MPDVLIFADTIRSPEMRHEIPAGVADAFFYAERDGRRYAIVHQLDADTVRKVAPDIEIVDPVSLGQDELIASGTPRNELAPEVAVRACRQLGIERAIVPPAFPVEAADYLRRAGLEITPAYQEFVERRLVKTPAQLAGIKRAQRAAEAGMRAAVEMLRAAEASNGT